MQCTTSAVYFVIIAACSFSVDSAAQHEARKNSGGISPDGMRTNYKLASYADAEADCLSMKETILQIDTSGDKELIEWTFGDKQERISQIWLDTKFRRINNSLEFFWANGKEINADLWAPGEPSQRTPETKIIAFWIGQGIFLKSDSNPDEDKNYICEY